MSRTWTARLDRGLILLAVSGLIATCVCDVLTAPAPRQGCHQEDPDVLLLMGSGSYLTCRLGVAGVGRLLRWVNGRVERYLAYWSGSHPADSSLMLDDLDSRLAEMKPRP